MLETKPDAMQARRRWDSYWSKDYAGPMLLAELPRPDVTPVEKPAYAVGHHGDFLPVARQVAAWAETHEFLGDAMPFYYLEFGADQFATFLGAEMLFPNNIDGNGWVEPFLDTIEDADLRFDPESWWWRRIVECVDTLLSECKEKVLIAAPTLVGNLDALAAVRGTQNLLIDLIEKPDAVHRALEQIDQAHQDILDAFADMLDVDRRGSINRHGFYASGPMGVAQCDFSCMISQDMFREFALPYITREITRYAGGEYHLDGPDAIRHLEDLATIEHLRIVQWVPGAGNEKRNWEPLFEKINALGKGQLRGATPEGLNALLERFSSDRLVVRLHGADRHAILDCMARWHEDA